MNLDDALRLIQDKRIVGVRDMRFDDEHGTLRGDLILEDGTLIEIGDEEMTIREVGTPLGLPASLDDSPAAARAAADARDRYTAVALVLAALRAAHRWAIVADIPRTLDRIRSARASAEGAERHAHGRMTNGQ
jgi:hypothetical protein